MKVIKVKDNVYKQIDLEDDSRCSMCRRDMSDRYLIVCCLYAFPCGCRQGHANMDAIEIVEVAQA